MDALLKIKKYLVDISVKLYRLIVRGVENKWFLRLTLAWFVLQAIYIAASTRFNIPPDELYHYSFIKLFAQSGWSPFLHTEQGYYYLGEVVRTPFFLYHYLLSLPFHFFGSSPHAVFYLRLINIALSFCFVLVAIRISRQLRLSKLITNLSIFLLANTLMFVFLSASINYDNLFNLFALLSFSLLVDLWKSVSPSRLLLLLAILVAGLLVKINFLPIAVGVIAVLVYRHHGSLRTVAAATYKAARQKRATYIIIAAILVVLLGLFVQRYVVNEVLYHTYSPSCTQLHTLQQCEQNDLFQRSEQLNAHPHSTTGSTNTLNYLTQWTLLVRDRTFGISGFKYAPPTKLIRLWSEAILLLAPIAIIRLYRLRKNAQANVVLGLALFYTAVLIYTNHNTYVHTGIIGLAVQGRYMFIVLPILYLFTNYYILKLLAKRYLQFLYVTVTVLVFLSASFPSYILSTNASWHTQRTLGINEKLQRGFKDVYHALP